MKKRSARDIPDFSKKQPRSPSAPAGPRDAKPASRPQPRQTVKPHATSSKSGRRGQ